MARGRVGVWVRVFFNVSCVFVFFCNKVFYFSFFLLLFKKFFKIKKF